MALSNVQLCIPKNRPATFVTRLAPYLKTAAMDKCMEPAERQAASREEAERLICLLPLLSCLLPHLEGSMASLSREMESDLLQIIQRNNYTLVSLL